MAVMCVLISLMLLPKVDNTARDATIATQTTEKHNEKFVNQKKHHHCCSDRGSTGGGLQSGEAVKSSSTSS